MHQKKKKEKKPKISQKINKIRHIPSSIFSKTIEIFSRRRMRRRFNHSPSLTPYIEQLNRILELPTRCLLPQFQAKILVKSKQPNFTSPRPINEIASIEETKKRESIREISQKEKREPARTAWRSRRFVRRQSPGRRRPCSADHSRTTFPP